MSAGGIGELIARLEKAESGSRQLDSAIFAHVGTGIWTPDAWEKVANDPDLIAPVIPEAPHYTTSLDSALTLVPKGVGWSFGTHLGWNEVDGVHPAAYVVGHEGRGTNPAVALCIASLRARAAQ